MSLRTYYLVWIRPVGSSVWRVERLCNRLDTANAVAQHFAEQSPCHDGMLCDSFVTCAELPKDPKGERGRPEAYTLDA